MMVLIPVFQQTKTITYLWYLFGMGLAGKRMLFCHKRILFLLLFLIYFLFFYFNLYLLVRLLSFFKYKTYKD